METEQENLGGRPTKYKASFNKQAYKLCLLGATLKEIAEFFEVNTDTVCEWQKQHVKFSESIRAGKIVADADVAQSLLKRAIGFKYKETSKEDTVDGVIVKETVKTVPGDVNAQRLWLMNRRGVNWAGENKTEQVVTVKTYEVGFDETIANPGKEQ